MYLYLYLYLYERMVFVLTRVLVLVQKDLYLYLYSINTYHRTVLHTQHPHLPRLLSKSQTGMVLTASALSPTPLELLSCRLRRFDTSSIETQNNLPLSRRTELVNEPEKMETREPNLDRRGFLGLLAASR